MSEELIMSEKEQFVIIDAKPIYRTNISREHRSNATQKSMTQCRITYVCMSPECHTPETGEFRVTIGQKAMMNCHKCRKSDQYIIPKP